MPGKPSFEREKRFTTIMANTITCWLGLKNDNVFTPHSIFDFRDCTHNRRIAEEIANTFAVIPKSAAQCSWAYLSSHTKKICYSTDPRILAEILTQSTDYDLGALSVFADTSLFNEIIKAGRLYHLNVVSPSDTVTLTMYRSVSMELISPNLFLHRMVPNTLIEADDNTINAAISIEQYETQKLDKQSQKSVTDNLTELERINHECVDDGFSLTSYGSTATDEKETQSFMNLAEIVDDLSSDMSSLSEHVDSNATRIDSLDKKSKLCLASINNAIKKIDMSEKTTQEKLDDIVEQISIVITEKASLETKTDRKLKFITIAIAAIATIAILSLFI